MPAPRHLPHGSHFPPTFAQATVADAMRHGMITAAPDAPAADVARMMAAHHIHAVIVAGVEQRPDGGRLRWGVIDGRDLLDAALQGRFDAATAGDLVGAPPVLVGVGMSLEEAARTMADAGVSHVVVVENDQPAGILSTLDIAVVLAWGRA